MLLEFSAENFRSLREQQTLSLCARAVGDSAAFVHHPNGLEPDSHGVLTTAAVFGANASGKSSLFMAAAFMRAAVLSSANSTVEGAGILEQVTTFRFDPAHRRGPVTLRVYFLLDGVRHEYGFTLQPAAADRPRSFTRVASEWLRAWPHARASDVFLRGAAAPAAGHAEPWWVSEKSFRGGRRLASDLFEQTRDDVLFLSLASQRNHPRAKSIVTWFNDQFCTDGHSPRPHTQLQAIENPEFLEYLGNLLRAADTGIERVEIDSEWSSATEPLRLTLKTSTRTLHRGSDGQEIELDLKEESAGTQRLFALAGPIHDALRHGRCLWIDELDTAMHHWLVRTLIKLFQAKESNPHGAQLLFTTHDAAVMDPTLLRRDQIWIVEKDAAQGSQLYSLIDLKDKPRKDQPLFKAFLSGRFGGVPRLDETAILAWPRK